MLITPEYEVLCDTISPLRRTGTDSRRNVKTCGELLGGGTENGGTIIAMQLRAPSRKMATVQSGHQQPMKTMLQG
jgi:hypothetical protein